MCLGALYWARPRAVYFAATRQDAAAAGFDDAFLYEELARAATARRLKIERLAIEGALRPFDAWRGLPGRVRY
jgi:guanine deaminase